MARSIPVPLGLLLLLLLPPARASAEAPRHAVSLGGGAAIVGRTIIAAPELGVGVRFRPRGWWYGRVSRGTYGPWDNALAQSDGGAFEVRTGPVWQKCYISGCHGVALELGWQRAYATYADGLTMPSEWSEVRHTVLVDGRWRGELHVYGDGLVALEASVGLRIQRAVHYESDPMTSWNPSVTSTHQGGWAASLALIARR